MIRIRIRIRNLSVIYVRAYAVRCSGHANRGCFSYDSASFVSFACAASFFCNIDSFFIPLIPSQFISSSRLIVRYLLPITKSSRPYRTFPHPHLVSGNGMTIPSHPIPSSCTRVLSPHFHTYVHASVITVRVGNRKVLSSTSHLTSSDRDF
jgi:hypothetical protein